MAYTEWLSTLTAAAQQWVEDAAAVAPGLGTAEAQITLQNLTHAALTRLAEDHAKTAAEPPPEPVSTVFPTDNPPSLWSLRGDLEAARAEQRRLSLMVQRGEVEPLATAKNRLFTEVRRLRDGWQRASENLGLRSRVLRDREAFKAAAVLELTRAGLLA